MKHDFNFHECLWLIVQSYIVLKLKWFFSIQHLIIQKTRDILIVSYRTQIWIKEIIIIYNKSKISIHKPFSRIFKTYLHHTICSTLVQMNVRSYGLWCVPAGGWAPRRHRSVGATSPTVALCPVHLDKKYTHDYQKTDIILFIQKYISNASSR